MAQLLSVAGWKASLCYFDKVSRTWPIFWVPKHFTSGRGGECGNVCLLNQGVWLDGVNGSNDPYRGWDGTQGPDGEEILKLPFSVGTG